MLKQITAYYFSPTGGTKKIVDEFTCKLAEQTNMVNLSKTDAFMDELESNVIVIAVPVFGGRIPSFIPNCIHNINGVGKKVITIVVYGNRAYEDALLELNNEMKKQQFDIVASAAFVAQHSMNPEIASNRPDECDMEEIHDFALKVRDKLEKGNEESFVIPGNYPYKEATSTSVTPITLEKCVRCGKCEAVCPVGAIKIHNSVETSQETCIQCCSCTSICPTGARILPQLLILKIKEKLGPLKCIRNKNEYYL